MSYSIDLIYPDETIAQVSNHEEGGTYAIDGTTDASLNVTYNYSWFYYQFLDKDEGIRWLYGKTAKDCIPRLEKVVTILGTVRNKDYWTDTRGNAGYALSILLSWAKQHPEATFVGD